LKWVVDGVLLQQFGMKVEVGHFAERWYEEDVSMDDVHFSKNELYQMLLKKMQEVNPPASPIELDEWPTGEEISAEQQQ